MDNLAVLGLYCSGNGFNILLEYKQKQIEEEVHEKTSDRLVEKLIELTNKLQIKIQDIGTVAVCVGPGSFTANRVAVSFVKGLACGMKNLKIISFTTFDLLTYNKNIKTCIIPAFSNYVYVCHNGEMSCQNIENLKKNHEFDIAVCERSIAEALAIKHLEPNYVMNDFVHNLKNKRGVKINQIIPIYLRASQAEIQLEKGIKNAVKNTRNE